MARVTSVAKCRKSPGKCGKCGKTIRKGKPYVWWKFRYGGKRVRCTDCPRPRPSELIASDKLSRVAAVGESVFDAVSTFQDDHSIDGLRTALEEGANELTEVAEEYRESAESIREHFSESETAEQCDEKADTLDEKVQEMESAASGLEEFELDEDLDEEALEAAQDAWVDEQVSTADEFTDIEVE